MKRIEISDTTVMGVAGQGDLLTLAIFLEEPIEIAMSLHVAQVIEDILGQAIDIGIEKGVIDRKTPTDTEKPSQMEIILRPDDGRIAFGFGDIEQSFTDEEAMKIAQTIARILRHKQSQARDAA
jgi:hypothetical protein